MAKLQVRFFLLPSLLLICDTVFLASLAQVYYVTPTPPPNSACSSVNSTGDLCQTLAYFASANNTATLINGRENVSLIFLDGHHGDLLFNDMAIKQVTSLTITGVSNHEVFIDNTWLTIHNVTHLVIRELEFGYLTNLIVRDIRNVVMDKVRLLSILSITNFSQVKISNCVFNTGVGITGNAMPTYASNGTGRNSEISTLPSIEISNSQSYLGYTAINIYVSSSIIVMFRNTSISDLFSVIVGPGLPVNTSAELFLTLTECFVDNLFLSQVLLLMPSNVEIVDCFFENFQTALIISPEHVMNMSVTNTIFQNSSLVIVPYNSTFTRGYQIRMNNVSFSNQIVKSDKIGVLYLLGPMNVTLENCLFTNNTGLVSPVILLNVNVFFVGNTTFSNNIGSSGGAIRMRGSTFWVDNNTRVRFENNRATQVGGAISITESDQLENIFSSVVFSSLNGGACFYQLVFEPYQVSTIFYFRDNSAPIGGHDIYGASLKSQCPVSVAFRAPNRGIWSSSVQQKVFEFQNYSLSTVSSAPKRVCLCDKGIPQCANENFIFYDIAVFSGEQFNLSVALVGDDFGLVTGSVYAQSLNNQILSLNEKDTIQQATSSRECTDLTYSLQVNTMENIKEGIEAKFTLSADFTTAMKHSMPGELNYSVLFYGNGNRFIMEDLLQALVVVTAKILPCPLGFELNGLNDTYQTCRCRTELVNYLENCILSNQAAFFYRNGTVWVGTPNSNSSTILAHSFCPFDYCNPDTVGVDLHSPDSQCALNHSGVLCGGCPPGLSIGIGSSRCLRCPDNTYVAFLLVFIVAGIVLVLFIKIFDLTVSHGTINGLVFFANALWINQSIFFSEINKNIYPGLIFLRVFIAWINLDFGIETCFIKGLDAYWKTWLQFVFPFYLWFIAGLIILVCRYSSKATRFFGNNTVPVLSTVFLLSYVKLLRTLVLVFGLAVLQSYGNQSEQGTQTVWLLDGNVPYFGLQHSFLFIMGFLVLVLLWLPYTIVLLFVRPLHKLPLRVISRLMIKFRPLLDSYTGPLKDKHQYWIGLTLIARVFLAVTAVSFQAVNPSVNLVLLGLASAILCSLVIQVYRKIYISLLELLFVFSLVILCFAYLSTDVPETRALCTSLATSFSFLLFIAIVCYHLASSLNRKCFKKQRNEYANVDRVVENNELVFSAANDTNSQFVTKTVVGFREALLESNVDK